MRRSEWDKLHDMEKVKAAVLEYMASSRLTEGGFKGEIGRLIVPTVPGLCAFLGIPSPQLRQLVLTLEEPAPGMDARRQAAGGTVHFLGEVFDILDALDANLRALGGTKPYLQNPFPSIDAAVQDIKRLAER